MSRNWILETWSPRSRVWLLKDGVGHQSFVCDDFVSSLLKIYECELTTQNSHAICHDFYSSSLVRYLDGCDWLLVLCEAQDQLEGRNFRRAIDLSVIHERERVCEQVQGFGILYHVTSQCGHGSAEPFRLPVCSGLVCVVKLFFTPSVRKTFFKNLLLKRGLLSNSKDFGGT